MNLTTALIRSLENNPSIILPLVREVPPLLLKRRPAPNEWSAHEIACHIASVHPLLNGRLDLMLHQENPVIRPYRPDADEAPGALLDVDLNEALDRFVHERRTLVDRLRILTPEDWRRPAQHEEYSHYTVFIMFRHLALHDLMHAYNIEQLLLKRDWA